MIFTIKGIRDVLEISWVNGWGEGVGTQANVWVEEVVKSHHCRVEIVEEEVQESGDSVTMKYSLIYLMAGRITDRWHQVVYAETHWCVCSGVNFPPGCSHQWLDKTKVWSQAISWEIWLLWLEAWVTLISFAKTSFQLPYKNFSYSTFLASFSSSEELDLHLGLRVLPVFANNFLSFPQRHFLQ